MVAFSGFLPERNFVMPGRMRCVHCETDVLLESITRLEPYHYCGHRYFARTSG
ncbi:hypothetical protein [Chromohalobacter sp.]|uniref:hypothetical protein n=1 Tax=Chromohalobacter sp. TaxID=50740 RepID=UPI00105E1884|nr:hypothetical protein [Chromohalobacter sp.]